MVCVLVSLTVCHFQLQTRCFNVPSEQQCFSSVLVSEQIWFRLSHGVTKCINPAILHREKRRQVLKQPKSQLKCNRCSIWRQAWTLIPCSSCHNDCLCFCCSHLIHISIEHTETCSLPFITVMNRWLQIAPSYLYITLYVQLHCYNFKQNTVTNIIDYTYHYLFRPFFHSYFLYIHFLTTSKPCND